MDPRHWQPIGDLFSSVKYDCSNTSPRVLDTQDERIVMISTGRHATRSREPISRSRLDRESFSRIARRRRHQTAIRRRRRRHRKRQWPPTITIILRFNGRVPRVILLRNARDVRLLRAWMARRKLGARNFSRPSIYVYYQAPRTYASGGKMGGRWKEFAGKKRVQRR